MLYKGNAFILFLQSDVLMIFTQMLRIVDDNTSDLTFLLFSSIKSWFPA